MRLHKKLVEVVLIFSCIAVVLVGCGKSNEPIVSTSSPEQSINVDKVEKEHKEIVKVETKQDTDKGVLELENKAKMLISYDGLLKEFTYVGSRGNLELIVGEPNSQEVEKMLFTINLDNILYDADNNTVIPPSSLIAGDYIRLYAMDNAQTGAITPMAIVKGNYNDLELISLDKVEKFDIKDYSVHVLEDKLSSTLIYVDDETVIVNSYSGEPILIDDIKDGDKLFIKTTKHKELQTTSRENKDTENTELALNDVVSENILVDELKNVGSTSGQEQTPSNEQEVNSDELLKEIYSKTTKATHISVYREAREQD